MRLVVISDTHGLHRNVALPAGDILIHSGDFMRNGDKIQEIADFNSWLGQQEFAHRLVVAGNHDRLAESNAALTRLLLSNAEYLNDTSTVIDGVTFWGSPITPHFNNWAFMRDRGPAIQRHWDMIPTGVDVLITHGPPRNVLDQIIRHYSEPLGCLDLARTVSRIRPKIHAFGHIHGSYGETKIGPTHFINAASLNEQHMPVNKPIVVDL